MFDSLTDRLGDVFDRLRRHGALSEDDVGAAMREIRVALLEADVALPVVRDFIAAVREKALGQEVLRSVTPAQMVVKIVHDHLVEVLGGGAGRNATDGLDLNAPSPVGYHAGRAAGLGQDHDRRQRSRSGSNSASARRCCSPRSTCSARRRRSSSPCSAARSA